MSDDRLERIRRRLAEEGPDEYTNSYADLRYAMEHVGRMTKALETISTGDVGEAPAGYNDHSKTLWIARQLMRVADVALGRRATP